MPVEAVQKTVFESAVYALKRAQQFENVIRDWCIKMD